MDNSVGAAPERDGRELRGVPTRRAILRAAAELIADLGWGNVTTRAIAERAGVPHGAISYHFSGKASLLREAALEANAAALRLPMALADQAPGVAALVEQTTTWFAAGGLAGTSVRLLLETAREAARDSAVRSQVAAMIATYREHLTSLVRRDQQRGALRADIPPEGVAAMIAGLLDGLLLHAVIDPALDLGPLVAAMNGLMEGGSS
ncbi:MAG TPA: TetR/AcrR family transcriptional regulator [Streptosporangiaceae bacterium]|jgi:AcrR family transcriptional regulator